MVKLHEIMRMDRLDEMISKGYVQRRANADNTALILTYTRDCMFDGEWNEVTRACRGIIYDTNLNVLARPWRKFFNSTEKYADPVCLSDPVEITDKVDGSLGIIYSLNGVPTVSTRGSLDSDQGRKATEMLNNYSFDKSMIDQFTFLVEIVYPGNRIVLDYGDMEELVLLGAVSIPTGNYFGPIVAADVFQWSGPVAEVFDSKNVDELLSRPNAEGVVVRQDNRMVKFKQQDYLEAHRAIFNINNIRVWEAFLTGTTYDEFIRQLPEEIHPYVKSVWNDLSKKYLDIHYEVTKAYYHLDRIKDRKEYAIEVMTKYPKLSKYLFYALDRNWSSMRKAIINSIRPKFEGNVKFL